jgi:hypothetical protein
VGADEPLRVDVAKKVAEMLRHPEVTSAFPAVLHNGKRQVLVALPTDKLGPLSKRLRSFSGPVNVAVGGPQGIEVIAFYPSPVPAPQGSLDNCDISKASEVGMLLALLRTTRKLTRCRFVEPDYEAELVEPEAEAFAGI